MLTIDKPMAKRPKAKPNVNSKGKKNARLISRMARNKPKIPVNPDPIMVSEDSDSEIERYLASEYPYSEGLCDKPSYDFVNNLPPCLQNDPNYPGIKVPPARRQRCHPLIKSSEQQVRFCLRMWSLLQRL
jgi:hypothetical protein